MNQITVLIVATTVAFAGLARAAPAKSSPSLWEMFNATDPGPEYWEERRFWPHFYKNLKKLPLNFCFQSTERALFRNSSYHHYLHNDIYIPEERQGMAGSEWRWPGGMIPVRIDPSWSTCIRLTCSYHLQYSIFFMFTGARAKANIVKGMQYLQDNTCIRFETYDPTNPKHNRFVKIEPAEKGFGCRSLIGRWNMPEGQWVKLERNNYCLSPGTVTHELIHSVGFWHEHQRPDRDDWVTINYDNIPESEWLRKKCIFTDIFIVWVDKKWV